MIKLSPGESPAPLEGRGGRKIWRYSVFAHFLDGISVIWIKNGQYSVFQLPNGDIEIQFLIENTRVTVFIQRSDYGITVIFEKINDNTVIQILVRLPAPHWSGVIQLPPKVPQLKMVRKIPPSHWIPMVG